MTIRRIRFALLALPLLASCAGHGAIRRSEDYLREGFVRQAYEEIERERLRQADAGAVDPELLVAWEKIRFAYLLDRGRYEVYADEELRAIALLGDALQLRPGDAEALSLIRRAQEKLARRETARGTNLLAKGEFDQAVAAFRQAQVYKPGYAPAAEGEQKVADSIARLHSQAQQQFLEAIRKLPEFRYSEVEWHAAAALARDEARDDAKQVRARALRELAMQEAQLAQDALEEKNYGAALMSYRSARNMWAGLPDVDANIARLEREVQATWKTEEAQLKIESNQLTAALAVLDEAFELSSLERTAINELRLLARKRQGQNAYAAARDLELQGDKAEALAAFEAMAAEWPDGLEDEQTRIGALRSDIDGAVKAYAAGEAAEAQGDAAAALDQFKTARTYYARYRDVAERIARIEAKLAAEDADG